MKIQSIDGKWKCVCGNYGTKTDGFYPAISVDPADAEWTKNCYVCSDCGRVIKQDTLRVVGYRVD